MSKKRFEVEFYLDKPQAMGWRGYSLLIPACASATGFFAFAVLAYGFTELAVLPVWFRTALVLVGAFCLAFGGEIGTLSNSVEIFRKNGQATAWDWAALVVSVMATLAAFLLAFAALLGVKATWAGWLQVYGPIVLGLLAALDSYGGFVEFGLYLNGFDDRMTAWQKRYERFLAEQFTLEREHTRQLELERFTPRVSSNEELNTRTVNFPAPIEQAQAARAVQTEQARQERLDKILAICKGQPDIQMSILAGQVNTSRTTLYNDVKILEQAGRVRRNGHGLEVLIG
jgi:hypothetical protein